MLAWVLTGLGLGLQIQFKLACEPLSRISDTTTLVTLHEARTSSIDVCNNMISRCARENAALKIGGRRRRQKPEPNNTINTSTKGVTYA